MSTEEHRLQGHWLLAKMGKRVLRPGGMELTRRILEQAKPAPADRIVELGPGVGKTAELLLKIHPVKINILSIDLKNKGMYTVSENHTFHTV